MKQYDLQGIDLNVPKGKAFTFIAEPENLPKWTNAFASVSQGKAVMQNPEGAIEIALEVQSSAEYGTVDWRMTFPDQSVATAFSRIVEADQEHCIYSFILMPPPVPLEQLEGALEAQSQILEKELGTLKALLEDHG